MEKQESIKFNWPTNLSSKLRPKLWTRNQSLLISVDCLKLFFSQPYFNMHQAEPSEIFPHGSGFIALGRIRTKVLQMPWNKGY